ncbi:hypothetical protein ACQP2X_39595 [Actinoplanes sp. CA-131856]
MTDEPSGTVAEESAAAPTANSNFAVLAAIADLGQDATPAAIAKKVGIAYSTVNPKLRAWETAGLAERFRPDSGQTLWRLTDAGRASTATPRQFTATAEPAEPTADTAVQAARSASPPPSEAEPSPATAIKAAPDGAGQEPATAFAPVAAGTDTSAPEPTTVDMPSGGELSSDEVPADNTDDAVSGTGEPVTVSDPATAAADQATEPDDGHEADAGTSAAAAAPATRRRPKGALQASALAVLQAHPDGEYTVDAVKKMIDQADAKTGYPRASHGAVSNALDKLEADAAVVRVDDRKVVTFRLTLAG